MGKKKIKKCIHWGLSPGSLLLPRTEPFAMANIFSINFSYIEPKLWRICSGKQHFDNDFFVKEEHPNITLAQNKKLLSQHAPRAAGSAGPGTCCSPWVVLTGSSESFAIQQALRANGLKDTKMEREALLLPRDAQCQEPCGMLEDKRSVLLQGEMDRAAQLGGGGAPSGGRWKEEKLNTSMHASRSPKAKAVKLWNHTSSRK